MNGSEIKIFENEEFGQVRTIEESDKILFCGSDIAKALGYTNPQKAIKDHCRCITNRSVPHPQSINKTIDMLFITEGDIYRLVVKSKLPSAEKFESWVFDEVIPSIRKHGAYMTPETLQAAILNPDTMIQLCQALKEEQEKRKALEVKVEEDKPKVEWADQCLESNTTLKIGDYAKLIHRENDIEIGQNRLFNFLRIRNILNENNMPYQEYMDRGWFEVIERPVQTVNGTIIKHTPKITPKGQQGLLKVIKKYYNK